MRKCYELIQGRHSKFWTVEVVGRHYLATFGRIGTTGQTQVKTFPSTGGAYLKATNMIAEKESKGYTRVGDNDHPGASATLLASLGEPAPQPVPTAVPKPVAQAPPRQVGPRRVVWSKTGS